MIRQARKQAGDTIVEVLIAMAIVSLVLGGAYASTNRNMHSTLESQERSQALKLVETQIEFLRAAAHGDPDYAFGTDNQCFNAQGAPQKSTDADACKQQADGTPAGEDQQLVYQITVESPAGGSTDPYKISAVWDSTLGTQSNVTLYYRPS